MNTFSMWNSCQLYRVEQLLLVREFVRRCQWSRSSFMRIGGCSSMNRRSSSSFVSLSRCENCSVHMSWWWSAHTTSDSYRISLCIAPNFRFYRPIARSTTDRVEQCDPVCLVVHPRDRLHQFRCKSICLIVEQQSFVSATETFDHY